MILSFRLRLCRAVFSAVSCLISLAALSVFRGLNYGIAPRVAAYRYFTVTESFTEVECDNVDPLVPVIVIV
jgi:hypothetical protein